mgnify:CR=1 FL=1
MNAWKTDIVTGTGVIGFAIFVLAYSMRFPAARGTDFGPALFPRVIASILVFLGLLVLLQAWRIHAGKVACAVEETGDGLTASKVGMRNVMVTIVAIIIYIIVVGGLGFIPTTVVFLFALMKAYGLALVKSIVFSLIITGFVYVLFSMLLRVVLP